MHPIFFKAMDINKIFGSILGGNPLGGIASSIFDGLFGSIFQGSAEKRQAQISKELMQFQSDLQYQQQQKLLATQMPQQVAGMKAAGLNPATVNGLSSAVSSPMASAGSTSPSPYMSSVATNMLANQQARQVESGIDVNKSLSKYYDELAGKTRSENELIGYDLMTYFNRYEADLQKTIYEGLGSKYSGELALANVDKVKQEISNLKEELNKLVSDIFVNNTIADLNRAELSWFDSRMSATIQGILAQANFVSNQDKRESKEFLSRIFLANSQGSMYRSQKNFQDVNRELLDWTLRMSKKYGDADKWVGYASELINGVIGAVGAVKGMPFAPISIDNVNSKYDTRNMNHKQLFDKYNEKYNKWLDDEYKKFGH